MRVALLLVVLLVVLAWRPVVRPRLVAMRWRMQFRASHRNRINPIARLLPR